MSKKQMGFTLIEIVMVLVLLGILSAVAVPKYFDLRDQAEQKAASAIVSEIQATLNGKFAKQLLDGDDCATARTKAVDEAKAVTVNGYTITLSDTPKFGPVKITLKNTSGAKNSYASDSSDSAKKIPYIGVPYCGSEGSTATATSGSGS